MLPALPNPETATSDQMYDFVDLLGSALGLEALDTLLDERTVAVCPKNGDLGLVAAFEHEGTHHTDQLVETLMVATVSEERVDTLAFLFFRDGTVEIRLFNARSLIRTMATWDEAYRHLLELIRNYIDQLRKSLPENIPYLT